MADHDGGGLPDNDKVLRHILSFAPAKEGASTAVLSRRWRSLWRTSGAVNLDSRSNPRCFSRRHMEAALAAAEAPVRRLTFHVDRRIYDNDSFHARTDYPRKGGGDEQPRHNKDMAAVLLSSPAAAGGAVEELRFEIADDDKFHSYRRNDDNLNRIKLRFGDLPSGSLTTLHVANVGTLKPPAALGAVFPRLAELHLRKCGMSSRADLRRIVGAAPHLATLHLLDCRYCIPRKPGSSRAGTEHDDDTGAVHCPAVTALVFEACRSCPWREGGLELDVPMLQYLRYRGRAHLDKRLPLKLSESSNPVQADLHFVRPDYADAQVQPSFWEFVQSFNVAKVLRLKLDIDLSLVVGFDRDDELLSNGALLLNLERLEVEVQCESTTKKSSAQFIANLLRLCPVLRDLHLKLNTKAMRINVGPTRIDPLADFNKSIDHFRNHKRPETAVSTGDDGNHEVSDIPGLSDHSFECLRSSLRTVSLQFWMGEPNCFGVQLAKFFAENGVVLEEISIDDGNHKMREHMNHMLRGWIRGSCKRKNSPSATAFRESYSRKRQK
jgi:hypothetical protein